jgi:hypothetical protein
MEKFDPKQYLLGVVQQAIARKSDIVINHEKYGDLIVLTVAGEYHTDIKDLSEFCQVDSSELDVRKLSTKDVTQISKDKGIGRNIDELMWTAAYYASNGLLMQGLNNDDVVHLKHWPNLSKLPCNFNTFQMAAMLTRHPTTIVFAHRVLKVPHDEINQFYSAAYCAGLAEVLNTPPVELSEVAETKEGTLLSRIMGRIARI